MGNKGGEKRRVEGIGEGEVTEKIWFGEKFVQKKYLGEKKWAWGKKMGVGKTSIALFDLGKKNASAKRGGGKNDKFGKYIPLAKCKKQSVQAI